MQWDVRCSLTHLPILSSVLLHHTKVGHLHCPLSTGYSQVILGCPAGIADNIGNQELDISLFSSSQENSNDWLLDGLSWLASLRLEVSETLGQLGKGRCVYEHVRSRVYA